MSEYWEVSADDFIAALASVGILHPTTKNVQIRAEAGDKVRLTYDEFDEGVSNVTLRPMNSGDALGLERLTAEALRSRGE